MAILVVMIVCPDATETYWNDQEIQSGLSRIVRSNVVRIETGWSRLQIHVGLEL